MDTLKLLAALQKPAWGWWPFPFLQPETGQSFGTFRLLCCILINTLFAWSLGSLAIFLRTDTVSNANLALLLIVPLLTFSAYFSLAAYAWNRFNGPGSKVAD